MSDYRRIAGIVKISDGVFSGYQTRKEFSRQARKVRKEKKSIISSVKKQDLKIFFASSACSARDAIDFGLIHLPEAMSR